MPWQGSQPHPPGRSNQVGQRTQQKEWYEPSIPDHASPAYGGAGGAGRGRDMVKPSWRGNTGLLPENGAQSPPQPNIIPPSLQNAGPAERPPHLRRPTSAAGLENNERGEDAFVTNDPWSAAQQAQQAQPPQPRLHAPQPCHPAQKRFQDPSSSFSQLSGPGSNAEQLPPSLVPSRSPAGIWKGSGPLRQPTVAEPPPGHAATANGWGGAREVNQAPRPAAPPGGTEQPKASAPPLAAGLRPAPAPSAAAADARVADDRGACTAAPRRAAPIGPRPWESEEWAAELLTFANEPSVELHVAALNGARVSEGLPCSAGEIVAAVSKQSDDLMWCVAYRDGARHEGSVPRSICQRPATYEFFLRLVVAGGERLGLAGSALPRGLHVEAVRPGGLIAKWNDGCARTFFRDVVRVGDVIVCANDVREPARMLDEMQNRGVVQLFVRRYGD